MFRSTLEVAHINGEKWRLTRPLVWEGGWQFVVIRSGFETDFASIPKPVRWLLDNAGHNSEAAVLHDAAWRESKRKSPRIDPWLADGMFRRALRETGAPALTRGLMWFAVRAAAMVSGRLGKAGPSLPIKILQLLCVFFLGLVSAAGPTIIAGVGLFLYWIWNWVAAVGWWLIFEHGKKGTNWPFWPEFLKPPSAKETGPSLTKPPPMDLLVIVSFAKDPTTPDALEPPASEIARADALRALVDASRDLTEAQIDAWLAASPA